MQLFSLDALIVIAFLVITLIIGLRAGRGIKDIREYATANKTFGTTALVLTFLATDTGVINLVNEIGKTGLILSLVIILGATSFVVQALVIAPRMLSFDKSITMGDVMGAMYGTNGQIITGILGFFTAICIAGMEIVVLGLLCESLLGIDYRWGVGIGGITLAIYSAHGGIKAVTVTDVFQFLILLVVLPIIAVLALKNAGGLKAVLTQVPATQLQIFNHPDSLYYLTLLLSFAVFQFNMVDPALVQRILMARNKRQVRNQFLAISVLSPAIQSSILVIGLTGLVLYPSLEGTQVVPSIIKDFLPVGLKGVAIAGLLAVSMATIDSFLHAAGLTLVHDVVKPLCDKKKLTINELKWAQYATVFVSLFAIVIGLARADDLYGLLLISYKFTGPLLAFPLFAGVLGLKPDQRAFYAATGITIIVLLLAEVLLPASQEHLAPFISVIVNGIVFLGMHAVRNKGFVIVKREEAYEYSWKPNHKSNLAQLQQLIPTPQRVLSYSQKQVAKYGAPYTLLGLFCIVNYIIPYFMWEYGNAQTYEFVLYLRFIGAMACGLLVVKEKWPQALLPYLPTYWHLTLLYTIPFTSTVMFLLTQGSVEWLINVAITIMFLIVLVDWLTFLILTALGIGLGVLFYGAVIGPVSLQLDFTTGYLLLYQGVFATLIGLLFARRKERRITQEHNFLKGQSAAYQDNFLQAATEKQATLEALQDTGIERLFAMARELQTVQVVEKDKKRMEALQAELIPMALQLQDIDTKAQDYLPLKIEKDWSIEQLFSTVRARLQEKGLKPSIHYKRLTQQRDLTCDPEQLAAVLTKSIELLQVSLGQQYTEEAPIITVALEDAQLSYPLPDVDKGYVKYVPALRIVITTAKHLPPLAPSYTPHLAAPRYTLSETTQDLAQLANSRIIKAHYGHAEVTDHALVYVVPVDIEKVRPQNTNKDYREGLDAASQRADDHFINEKEGIDAQRQEQEFLADVAARSKEALGMAKMALELIKWHHGPKNRNSGEPFYLHPLAVAQIVLDYDQDKATIIGALLHDTVEDTPILLQHMESIFGKEITGVVDMVTHLQSTPGSIYKVKLSAAESLQMLERTGNKRGLHVKLADRMHNMRTIKGHSELAKQKLIAKETLQFFVPLAERLGLHGVAEELRERSMAVIATTTT